MKGRPWTPASLREVGGAAGVGVTFLEETFSARTAPPPHRYHETAARAVLQALLPPQDTEIKGHMRTRDELLAASGYSDRPRDFQELLHLLDAELRLITPAESDTGADGSVSSSTTIVGYQLTHDYLVPSLRDWLTKKQRETRRGRARLLLSDRTGAWNVHPEPRHLPSLAEHLAIRAWVPRREWSEQERRLMQVSGRRHLLRWGTLFGLLTLFVLALAIGCPVIALREAQLRQQADKYRGESNSNLALARSRLASPSYL
jgi:hypothetical protein